MFSEKLSNSTGNLVIHALREVMIIAFGPIPIEGAGILRSLESISVIKIYALRHEHSPSSA
jgi:hypothetical protein